jgi:hypothetical protein
MFKKITRILLKSHRSTDLFICLSTYLSISSVYLSSIFHLSFIYISITFISIIYLPIYHLSSIYFSIIYISIYISFIYHLSIYISVTYHLSFVYHLSIIYLSIIYILSITYQSSIYHLSFIYQLSIYQSSIYLSSVNNIPFYHLFILCLSSTQVYMNSYLSVCHLYYHDVSIYLFYLPPMNVHRYLYLLYYLHFYHSS